MYRQIKVNQNYYVTQYYDAYVMIPQDTYSMKFHLAVTASAYSSFVILDSSHSLTGILDLYSRSLSKLSSSH